MVEVINIKKCPDWGTRAGDIYIGRGSTWGNPFLMNRDTPWERNRVIELYKKYFDKNPMLMAKLVCARPIRLGCHCKPKPCHGDYLKERLDSYNSIVGSCLEGYLEEKSNTNNR